MTKIDADISKVSQNRGTVGSYQNRMEYTVANLQIMAQNSQASESQIRDADFAVEMAQFTKHQVLQQAGVAILSQANQITQSVLSLLR
jgi:flagellin